MLPAASANSPCTLQMVSPQLPGWLCASELQVCAMGILFCHVRSPDAWRWTTPTPNFSPECAPKISSHCGIYCFPCVVSDARGLPHCFCLPWFFPQMHVFVPSEDRSSSAVQGGSMCDKKSQNPSMFRTGFSARICLPLRSVIFANPPVFSRDA